MKELTFKRISTHSLVLIAVSVATAYIAIDRKVVKDLNGHLTQNGYETSDDSTCRTPIGQDMIECNDTQANSITSTRTGEVSTRGPANGWTSSDAQNTTVPD